MIKGCNRGGSRKKNVKIALLTKFRKMKILNGKEQSETLFASRPGNN